jgi:Uma2 family endonuclease
MSDMAMELPRPLTVEEYRLAWRSGVYGDDRVELIDGLVLTMPPIGNAHWRLQDAILDHLKARLGQGAYVIGQGSFPIEHRSEPQPDIAVLAPHQRGATGDVTAEDIYAIVEVADSSLQRDLGTKRRLYARCGIPDYLVVDVRKNLLLHFSAVQDGQYAQEQILSSGQTFCLAHIPTVELEARCFLMPLSM